MVLAPKVYAIEERIERKDVAPVYFHKAIRHFPRG
jgi:hypothetical protein